MTRTRTIRGTATGCIMIAVEFTDWNGPRTQPNNQVCVRTGLLLQVLQIEHNHEDHAYVLTNAMEHDSQHRGKAGETIIVRVKMEKIVVKGVSIPFTP